MYDFTKWEDASTAFILTGLLSVTGLVWLGFYSISTLKDGYFLPVEEDAEEAEEEEEGEEGEAADDDIDNDLDASLEW